MPAPVIQQYDYQEINAAGTFTVKSGPGFLHRIVVNAPGGATIRIYDNTAASGTAIVGGAAAVAIPAAGSLLDYDVNFQIGLTIVIATMTAGSITVSFA